MQPLEFAAFHQEALELDESRHSIILSLIGRLKSLPGQGDIMRWTLGGPGECAMMGYPFPIMLGNLSQAQCRALAEITRDLNYAGVVGPEETALWFSESAEALGLNFAERIPQRIMSLSRDPTARQVPGSARRASLNDFEVFCDWTLAFLKEAVPHDPLPTKDALRITLEQGRHWFWLAGGEPVSMAAITRRLKITASINSVFTPPEHRNRGFAGAVTAAVARQVFSEGYPTACLYTDLRNAASNQCYIRLGFRPVCDSWCLIRSK